MEEQETITLGRDFTASSTAQEGKGHGSEGVFKKYFWNSGSFVWIGSFLLLGAPVIVHLSIFMSLGLSMMGSEHRHYDGNMLIDPIENFTRAFVIPSLLLSAVMIPAGTMSLAVKRIFRDHTQGESFEYVQVRLALAICVIVVCFSILPTLVFLFGNIAFDFQNNAESWKPFLPFPELAR